MQLQTQLLVNKQTENLIDYSSKILLIGSCFSENIGAKFSYYKYQSVQNPLGILFHPKAIENLVAKAVNKCEYTEDAVFFYNERWHCFDAHSSLSTINKNDLLRNLNLAVHTVCQQLKNASHIVLTFGTAWVYRYITSNKIVANCHKIPQKKFSKNILSVSEIVESLTATIQYIQSINKKATVILTVSPVRHLKDGFLENTQSKAHLIAGVHQFIKEAKNANITYFPSYEILMDELRDYRFYKPDMLHPNLTAIDYIWEKWVATWVAEKATKTMLRVAVIQKGLAHKALNPNTKRHLQFLENLKYKKQLLQQEFPFMQF